MTPLIAAVAGRWGKTPQPIDLPPGQLVDLPGRGTTCVIDRPGPPGAPTLILLHALATTAALSWYPSLEALAEHYRVITFDQRWHGRGIRCETFRFEDCADDVVAVADAMGVDKFTVVGYSMGGAIAQLVWRRHRDRVEGLVLAATARNFRGKMTERMWFLMTHTTMTRWGNGVRTRADKLHSTLPSEPLAMSADALVGPWAMTVVSGGAATLEPIFELGTYPTCGSSLLQRCRALFVGQLGKGHGFLRLVTIKLFLPWLIKIPEQPATTTVPTQPDESEPHPLVTASKAQRVSGCRERRGSAPNGFKAAISACLRPDLPAYQGFSIHSGCLTGRVSVCPGPHIGEARCPTKKILPGHGASGVSQPLGWRTGTKFRPSSQK